MLSSVFLTQISPNVKTHSPSTCSSRIYRDQRMRMSGNESLPRLRKPTFSEMVRDNLKPVLRFASTETGRRSALFGAGAGAAVLFSVFYYPQAFFADRFMKVTQMYKNGLPVKPKPSVIELAAEALGDLELPEKEAKKIRWFTAFGFDPIRRGDVGLNSGAVIGLPVTFSYRKPEDIDRASIRMFRDKWVPWSSDEGKALADSLLLSDDARKFAIAREIFAVRTSEVTLSSFAVSLHLPIIAGLAHSTNDKYGLFQRSFAVRSTVYAFWLMVGGLISIALYDIVKCYYERCADREVAMLGENYSKGGVEFYSKHLLRNRALRELLGPAGLKTYNANGDLKYWIRKPHEAISARKKFMETQRDLDEAEKAEKIN